MKVKRKNQTSPKYEIILLKGKCEGGRKRKGERKQGNEEKDSETMKVKRKQSN